MAQKRTYEVPESLAPAIAVADKYGVLVTSTTGGGHNKGSKHYIGEAFDIDHKKLNANPKLKQAFFGDLQNLGFGYIDETTRPKGQAVWGGPHYHIQKGLGQQSQPVQRAILPTLSSMAPSPLPALPNVPAAEPIFGSWKDIQAAFGRGESPIRKEYTKQQQQLPKIGEKLAQQAVNVPQIKAAPAPKYETVQPSQDISALIDEIKNAKLPEAQPVPLNPLEQFGQGFSSAVQLYGPQTDVAAQQSGESLPYQAGNLLGAVGVNLAGAGLGFLGGPAGIAAGNIAAGGALAGGASMQRQRLAGEPIDYRKVAGEAAIGGGLNWIPAVGTGLKMVPRTALNAGLQGLGQALMGIPQQAIEQGTWTPTIDVNRLKNEALLGAAGGAVGGLMSRGKPRPITVGGQRRPVQVGGQMVGADGNAARQRVVFGGLDIAPPAEPVRSTLDPTNPASYGLPETPKVKPVEYASPQVEGTEQLRLFGPKGTDAALYDVANSTPETNPAAWAAAREGLQEYGDLNIQDVGKKVGEVVDALPPGEVVPENITQRLVAPKAKDPIANASPRPQTPQEIVATSRKLAGTVDEMIAQGTEASPIKTKEQYINLTKAYKELKGGIGRYNRDIKNGLIDLSDLTPEVMVQRGGMLNDMINTGQIIPQPRVISPRVLRDFQVNYQRMLDNTLNEGQLAKMQATIADMEYRAQLQSLSDQMDTIHPEVRKAWEFDYDPQTKLAMQKEGADAEAAGGRTLKRFEDVSEGLPENLYNRAKMVEDAAKRGASLRIDADTEITGATSRVSQREVTPIGFYRTKDGHVGFTAYNDDGHLANYYITPKANPDTGMISQVKSVEILGSEKFRGEYANVYLGPREFRVDDILKRPPRMEGVTTSQARQTLRKAAGVFNNPELQALNPRVKDLMDQISKNPDRMTIEDVKNIEELLTADRKVLKAACEILGRL